MRLRRSNWLRLGSSLRLRRRFAKVLNSYGLAGVSARSMRDFRVSGFWTASYTSQSAEASSTPSVCASNNDCRSSPAILLLISRGTRSHRREWWER
jgi:hypothetical protein